MSPYWNQEWARYYDIVNYNFVSLLAEEEIKVFHIVAMFGEEKGLGARFGDRVHPNCSYCRRGIHCDGKC